MGKGRDGKSNIVFGLTTGGFFKILNSRLPIGRVSVYYSRVGLRGQSKFQDFVLKTKNRDPSKRTPSKRTIYVNFIG